MKHPTWQSLRQLGWSNLICVWLGPLGSKAGMQNRCNKCKFGQAAEGDSWCTGCSALELGQSLLGQRWHSPGVRRIAEEQLITSARLVRAFSQLDRTLHPSAGTGAEPSRPYLPAPPPPPPRAQRHPEPERERSRRRRSSTRRREEKSPLRRKEPPPALQPKRRPAPSPREEEDDEFTEESDEEEERVDDHAERDPPPEIKSERGQEPPPEPKEPPRRKRGHKKSRKKKKKTRGGKKHQRHYREQANPLKLSHRKLKGADLELSRSARHALERRIWGRKPR